MQTAIVLNFFEFRTGVWLPRAYFAGLDPSGRPRTIHETAKVSALGTYGLAADPKLLQALELAESLRERTLAEHFRRGSKRAPTLAGLIKPDSKDRAGVLRHIHARTASLLQLARAQDYLVTLNLDPRAAILPAQLHFAAQPLEPRLYFTLTEEGMQYRLRLIDEAGEEKLVRYLDPKIITNRPAPGWVIVARRLYEVRDLRGDALRPFLTRDEVRIPPGDVPRYFKRFVARAARKHDLIARGFTFGCVTVPTAVRIAARRHPFGRHYLLYVSFAYGAQQFSLGEPEQIAVTHTLSAPYHVVRAQRNPTSESGYTQPLLATGLAVYEGALSVTEQPGEYDNLRHLLAHRTAWTEAGYTVAPPREDGHAYAAYPSELELTVERQGDWLDLLGTVRIGPHTVPFYRLVKLLQQGERRYQLPTGEYVILPEEWFRQYAPGLALARTQGGRVRMTRSQSALLTPMGLTVAGRTEQTLPEYTPGPELRAELRPYQLAGVRWLVRHYHEELGACLADDMGLGKTLQTIAVLLHAKGQQAGAGPQVGTSQGNLFASPAADEAYLNPLRALIVLPASLVYNWSHELSKFAPSLTVVAHIGSKRVKEAKVLRRYDVLLTTYQTALRDLDLLTELQLTYIVLDESQQIKNRQSKVFRALNALPARHRISLSGTPIENSLSDLWSQMQFINPGLLGTYAFFKRSFITPIEQHDDAFKKAQLRQLVGPHLLRRTKAEVAPDLPELDVQLFFCEMTPAQRRHYERERSAARNALLGTPAPEDGKYKLRVIQTLTRLRQLANHPVIADADYTKDSGKFNVAISQWDTLRRAGHKVLVFSSMVKHLELFRAQLEALRQPYAWLTGGVDSARRAQEVARFQEDPSVQTFLISIKAGGSGLNLTAADYVFILDPWWNPTTEDQAIARAHRIGRRGHVFARKFLSKGTLEEKIHQLQQRKKRLAGEIIDGTATVDLDPREIDFLLT